MQHSTTLNLDADNTLVINLLKTFLVADHPLVSRITTAAARGRNCWFFWRFSVQKSMINGLMLARVDAIGT